MTGLGARLARLPADTRATLSFFSRLPIDAPAGSFGLHQSAGAWPLTGLLLAIGPTLLFWLAVVAHLPSLLAAVLALAALALTTGAMHEDGLADTADGLAGGKTRAQKLDIMRDSRLGTFGALALLFSVLIRAGALAAILYAGAPSAALAILLAAVTSRSMALWHWNATMPARTDGLARAAGRPDWLALAIGLGAGAIAAIVLLLVFGLPGLIGVLLAAVATGAFTAVCVRQIGGHTGDTIGATQQIAETALLLGLTIRLTDLSS